MRVFWILPASLDHVQVCSKTSHRTPFVGHITAVCQVTHWPEQHLDFFLGNPANGRRIDKAATPSQYAYTDANYMMIYVVPAPANN